ncbi:MAG: thioredoxin family protein [Nostoc sp. NOS(2021)]|uniref:thioredoxin family protein n=1 Tax=Nostoc sp. NOS(2021) TaxID=2815407 RepID=UPI0025E56C70|nr:thioredoxin family protein [Nostoc sp. NOS(2021)]MBN3896371.1 thioredoxin family protein [Nostoc sp. NOS(2021)]
MNLVETIDTPVGSYAPDFELPGIDAQVHHLRRYLEKFRAVGVISMCNHCPYVDSYLGRLKNIQAEFAPEGFTLIGVNVSNGDRNTRSSFENMKAFARSHDLNFPYLWDSTQDVTRSFGATKTPTAFLIDTNGIVRYKGKIDDHPQNPSLVGEDYLRTAIASLLQGQEIDIPQTEAIGTTLIWRN